MNTSNDLTFDARGNVWFIDSQDAWFTRLTVIPPQLAPNIYIYNMTTKEPRIVDAGSLFQPNDIVLSPDGSKMYVTDSGATNGNADPRGGCTRHDLQPDWPKDGLQVRCGRWHGPCLKRNVFYRNKGNVDRIKVAANGQVVLAAGNGVDVFDEIRSQIMRAQANFTVNNLAFAGSDLQQLWMVCGGGLARLTWDLAGFDIARLASRGQTVN